jgi:hypothetical protein
MRLMGVRCATHACRVGRVVVCLDPVRHEGMPLLSSSKKGPAAHPHPHSGFSFFTTVCFTVNFIMVRGMRSWLPRRVCVRLLCLRLLMEAATAVPSKLLRGMDRIARYPHYSSSSSSTSCICGGCAWAVRARCACDGADAF